MALWNAWLAGEWGPVITAAITLAAALSTIISSRSSSPVVQGLLDIVSVVGLNVGAAKNADDDRG
tara:strand:+ start:7939 stop:8133 length:195 start_codon:yes stop_codon:yes gene_type:complete